MTANVHLATNGIVVATVGGPSYKKTEIRRLATALDANVAFIGLPSDLIALPKAGVNRTGVLATALAKNGKLLVLAAGRIVTVCSADLQYNDEQLNALQRTASSAFKPRAEVVVP